MTDQTAPADVELFQLMLEDLHQELEGKLVRYRQLTELGRVLGESGTMVFGGMGAYTALVEARSSFVHGNFIATIFLCQSLIENCLAGLLHLRAEELPLKITFNETLARCEAIGILTADEVVDLKKLTAMRNPLTHFRNVSDPDNLTRRSMNAGLPAEDLLAEDAGFAIDIVMRVLAKRPFRVGR